MGEQARAMAGELDFDSVVLDLSLPRLDGVSIFALLADAKTKRSDPGAPGTQPGLRTACYACI
jgi:DNA-binding response OmpR family regulator